LNALIFGVEHPWDKKIQVFANRVPGVINGPCPRETYFYIGIYRKTLRKSSSQEPMA